MKSNRRITRKNAKTGFWIISPILIYIGLLILETSFAETFEPKDLINTAIVMPLL